jgi:hypothetical protein
MLIPVSPVDNGHMSIWNVRDKKAYSAHRLCRAIDRLVSAPSFAEKEHAIRWTKAWSTAYLARVERRRDLASAAFPRALERRQRGKYPR